jgi:hypothetical protein
LLSNSWLQENRAYRSQQMASRRPIKGRGELHVEVVEWKGEVAYLEPRS